MALDATNSGEDEGAPPSDGMLDDLSGQNRLFVRVGIALLGLVAVYVVLDFVRGAYADWLWFSSLGLSSVYKTVLITRVWLFVVGLIVSVGALWWAYRYAWQTAWGPTVLPFSPRAVMWMRRGIIGGMLVMGWIVAFSFASGLSNRWELFLRFMNSTTFGREDPQFNIDVGFYIFVTPMLHTIQGWLMGLAIVVLITTAGVYMLIFSARGINPIVTPRARTQLAVVGAFLMVTIAGAHWLDTYETLFSTSGAVTGSSYADVNARIPALWLLTAISLISAGLMIFSIRVANIGQSMRLLAAAFGLWATAGILAGLLWPALTQRFAVDPSELERERPYIERNIEWTRFGYDLDQISERPYVVRDDLLARDIANNPETINNIRLWDPRPLEDVYNQIQHLRLYYNFLDVDVDRYNVDGEYRQVLVGTRELFQSGLDDTAQNWVNRRLVYTHGYGVVMASATDFNQTGQPNLLVKDVPSVGTFPITEPRIYYGESFGRDASLVTPPPPRGGVVTDDAVIVNTTEPQFDRPPGGPGELPIFLERYDGTGGVSLSNFLRRVIYAWELEDINFILSSQLTDESRVLYNRGIRGRVQKVAPFLLYDDDPYMALVDGKLFWIQDAFIATDRLPYSRRQTLQLEDDSTTSQFNYIRNSVKVVMDPFNGSLDFYTLEPNREDPVLTVYRNMFPDLFKPISEMSAGLRQHIRYPEELLRAQADSFVQYHMTDPKEFFLKEDQWELAEEIVGSGRPRTVSPYYVIMKLPDEPSEEFVLILPFTPQDKPNLIAWMAARSDGDHYGEIIAFEFPTDRIFNGPSQIEARIDNDPTISEQFTLWDQSGSRVIRGNLLVIPIGEALLYAEPIYLQADSLPFPELKRVILATNDNVVMEPTLAEAVASLLGGRPAAPSIPAGEPVLGGIPPEELRRVLDDLSEALQALQGGAEGLDRSLEALQDLAGGAS
ncbi:MAG: UPF0182 family protein [Dehalococcoidia bacterium]